MTPRYDIEWLEKQVADKISLRFMFFWGHTSPGKTQVGKFCFSQWFPSEFKVNEIVYKTAEHWMMAQKARLFGDRDIFDKVIKSDKPAEAKQLGSEIKGFDDFIWREKRYQIVVEGNKHKFGQNEELADYLIKTGDSVLVEASPVDTIWGIGLPPDKADIEDIKKWRGLNLLGFALMETRDYLKLCKTDN